MAKFGDLDERFEDFLTLPVGGKPYVIPSPDAELGLWLQRLVGIGMAIQQGAAPEEIPPLKPRPGVADDIEISVKGGVVGDEHALYRRLLGPVWDELHVDGVSWAKIKMVSETAMFWVGAGLPVAEAYWDSGGDPEALAPNRQARRSRSTGGANTTRSQNSTSTTKSPRTAKPR